MVGEVGSGHMASAGARAYNKGLGVEPLGGLGDRDPGGGSGGEAPHEADSF